jgi:hypothetical protein
MLQMPRYSSKDCLAKQLRKARLVIAICCHRLGCSRHGCPYLYTDAADNCTYCDAFRHHAIWGCLKIWDILDPKSIQILWFVDGLSSLQ